MDGAGPVPAGAQPFGQRPADLAGHRHPGDGVQHLVHALHRHAGVRSGIAGQLRPGPNRPVPRAGHRGHGHGLPGRGRWQWRARARGRRRSQHGAVDLRHALCRHGGGEDGGGLRLRSGAGRPVLRGGHSGRDGRPGGRRPGPFVSMAGWGGHGARTGHRRDALYRHDGPAADPAAGVRRPGAGGAAGGAGRNRGGGRLPDPDPGPWGGAARPAGQRAGRPGRRRGRLLGTDPAGPRTDRLSRRQDPARPATGRPDHPGRRRAPAVSGFPRGAPGRPEVRPGGRDRLRCRIRPGGWSLAAGAGTDVPDPQRTADQAGGRDPRCHRPPWRYRRARCGGAATTAASE